MKRLVFRGCALVIAAAISTVAGAEVSPSAPSSTKATLPSENLPAAKPDKPVTTAQAQTPPPVPAYVSPWVNQVLKLSDAGIEPEVIINFIGSAGTFNLTSEQVADLSQRGVPGPVIAAMLSHDTDLRAGLLPLPAPPPSDATAKLPVLVASTSKPSAVNTPAEEENFVHQSPAEDQPPVPAFDPDVRNTGSPSRKCRMAQPLSVQTATDRPVREPFPVQLTDPIRVFRAGWRTPNIQILQTLP